jgi:hypothetical protein
VPSSVFISLANNGGPLQGVLPTGTGDLETEAWFTSLPSDVKSYFHSAASQEAVIARESAKSEAAGWMRPASLGIIGCVVGVLGIVL